MNLLPSKEPLAYDVVDLNASDLDDGRPVYHSTKLTHCLAGFRIPTLPVVAQETGLPLESHLARLLHRFVVFLGALHEPRRHSAVALHFVAHPDRSILGAEVGIYLLCRVASQNYAQSVSDADRLANLLYQLFPAESLFNYDTPLRLHADELRRLTFQDVPEGKIRIAELCKFEEHLTAKAVKNTTEYIPHPFWVDNGFDPWLTLIEMLSNQQVPTSISVLLEPTELVEKDFVETLAEQFRVIADEGSKRSELMDQSAQVSPDRLETRSFLQMLSRAKAYRAQGISDSMIAKAQRGAHVYGQLMAWQDQLFSMRIMLAAQGGNPNALTQAVRAALSVPSQGTSNSDLGWKRPAIIRPVNEDEQARALLNLRWLGKNTWGRSEANPKLRRLRHLVTAQEAVGLFHLPIMPQAGQTTALSTADVPFVIPPEVVSTRRFKEDDGPLINFGYLYQRQRYLAPELVGEDRSVDFKLRLSELEKPSLLVGSPGSGKSNLALYLLTQLWKDHGVPFLVLDPSTGHEFRYLFADPSLQDDLVVYTLGDEEWLPFRFNPFEVPPGVTVRGHITRLLACFKAAYEMWDPLPAIYQAALARVYTSPPYKWALDDKGESGHPSPCLANFAQAVIEELEENVMPDYGQGTEAGGILTGASKIRVNSILNNMGYILNVRHSDLEFFQRLLMRPAVIELGALGDPDSIALVMAFLITQLVGHIEYAHRQGVRDKRPHLLLIEEAHRLLSTETTATSNPNQGNVRGKSAEEMNTLLAEMRKFRQGIMVLDQRPSSLVGGVLDNARINIMCRLNDRAAFEHLSNVLNLSPIQQRYARSRLKAGDAIMLDSASGQPVLMRAPNVVDPLRESCLPPSDERQRMYSNALRAKLLPPPVEEWSTTRDFSAQEDALVSIWSDLVGKIDEAVTAKVVSSVESEDWGSARRAIRTWLMQNRMTVNPLLEKTVLIQVLSQELDLGENLIPTLKEFEQSIE